MRQAIAILGGLKVHVEYLTIGRVEEQGFYEQAPADVHVHAWRQYDTYSPSCFHATPQTVVVMLQGMQQYATKGTEEDNC